MKKITLLLFILTSIFSFSQESNTNAKENDNLIMGNPFIYPEFPGGEDKLYEFINKNLRYPKLATEPLIEGIVYMEFLVTKNGDIEDANVIKSLFKECDEEALRIINMMPKWKPGKLNGEFVDIKYMVPIKFEIVDEPFIKL